MSGPASTSFAFPAPLRDPRPLLEQTLKTWGGGEDLWIFGYASLIWRPDFEFTESRIARVHGWHRALKMWSRVNRGTPEVPGLVFALLSGGSCHGVAYRVAREQGAQVLERMWLREMVTGVYDPRWLPCRTSAGPVRALAFTLSRGSPNYTGPMSAAQYHAIFQRASGRYGTTLEYAESTRRTLVERGIPDRTLHRLLRDYGALPVHDRPGQDGQPPAGTTSANRADAPWPGDANRPSAGPQTGAVDSPAHPPS